MSEKTKCKVWFVTVFYVPWERWDIYDKNLGSPWERKRTWGFFSDFARAEKSVLENWTDMYEQGYYNLALLEGREEGLLADSEYRWYRVSPQINQAAVDAHEAHKKAWEEAYFFGKRLGQILLPYVRARNPAANEDIILLRDASDLLGFEWVNFYHIQSGSKPPVFTDEQWSNLRALVSSEEEAELKVLREEALADTQHHGVPPDCRNEGVIAFSRSSATSGPQVISGGWMVDGYTVTECDAPACFGELSGYEGFTL